MRDARDARRRLVLWKCIQIVFGQRHAVVGAILDVAAITKQRLLLRDVVDEDRGDRLDVAASSKQYFEARHSVVSSGRQVEEKAATRAQRATKTPQIRGTSVCSGDARW